VQGFYIVKHGMSGNFCATLDAVLLKKLTVAPTVKKSPAFCRSSRFL